MPTYRAPEDPVVSIKRVKHYDFQQKRVVYKDRIVYEDRNGIQKTVYQTPLSGPKRESYHRAYVEELRGPESSRKSRPPSGRANRRSTSYESSIKAFIIVRQGNSTPFFFPKAGGSSFFVRRAFASEESMLHYALGRDYDEFLAWLARWRQDPSIRIIHGWRYRRAFSPSGFFDGDVRLEMDKQVVFTGRGRVVYE